LSTIAHNGLPRLVAIDWTAFGSALHLEKGLFVSQPHTSCDGIESLKPNMGELGSCCSAASAPEKASIRSGVGSGDEGGLKQEMEGD
jgi:hypothetical protein